MREGGGGDGASGRGYRREKKVDVSLVRENLTDGDDEPEIL